MCSKCLFVKIFQRCESKAFFGTDPDPRIRTTELRIWVRGSGSVQIMADPDPGGPKAYGAGSGFTTLRYTSFEHFS